LMLRRQMLDHNKGHPRVGRRVTEEVLQGFETARGSTDTHNRKGKPRAIS
jgi:hypothetical protein